MKTLIAVRLLTASWLSFESSALPLSLSTSSLLVGVTVNLI